MALAAKTAVKAKLQATSGKASKKRHRSDHVEEEEDELQKEDTHLENLDDDANSNLNSTTSSEVSRFIDRSDRRKALSIEIRTEKSLESRIVNQKQINANKMKELSTARHDYPSEIADKVTKNFIIASNHMA